MTPDEAQQIAATSLLVSGVFFVIAIGVYVWYAVMLAKVFAQFGRPGWAAWIPVYNEMQVFRIGGQQPWLALLLYVPFAAIVGLVFKVFALHRISMQSWRGVGTTVLGVLLPPVWATVLAVGPSPDPERGRMPRGPVTGAIPPVQPNGPLGSPYDGAPVPVAPVPAPVSGSAGPSAAGPSAQGAAPLPAWLVPGSPVPAASAQAAPAPAQAPTASASATPLSAVPVVSPDPASSPFAPPSAFAAAEPARVPGRIEPLPPMPGSAPIPAEVPQQQQPQPAAQPPQPAHPAAAFAPGANPFIAPPTVATPEPAPAANPFAMPAEAALPPAGAQAVATPLDAFEVDDAATIVTGDDDPFDRTVVVERRPAFLWRLVLADRTALALEGPAVLLGRNPRPGDDGARALVVPDPSRTLSKTHALIRFDGRQWWVTDLDSTNGVLLADESGTDRLIEVGVPTPFSGRFVLGTLEVRVEPDPRAGDAYR